jgi:hypothetical protein
VLALSIRQPYAELILRGRKRIEYRTMNVTKMLGERFYLYAALGTMPVASERRAEEAAAKIWSDDLAVTTPRRGEHPPEWLMELAEELITGGLPRGVIVGTAVIEKVIPPSSLSLHPYYEWHLGGVERAKTFRKPTGRPQPVWFKPFD